MNRYLKIAFIIACCHFTLCSAIFIWYFGVQHRVNGDEFLWRFLNHVLLLVDSIRHMYRGKGDAIFSFVTNSVIWGLVIALPVNAIASKFQRRANPTALNG